MVPATVACHAILFPDGSQWGTAAAAHQIEGGNVNNDWWEIEHDPTSGCADPSGEGCDSFHRCPEDIALIAGLRLGCDQFPRALARVGCRIDDGIDVPGYKYRRLLDDFEWDLGHRPTFGIVEVDRQTLERRPRPSATSLGGVATARGIREVLQHPRVGSAPNITDWLRLR